MPFGRTRGVKIANRVLDVAGKPASRSANSEGGANQTRAGAAGSGQVQRQQAQTWQRDERPTREREGIEVNTLAMRIGSVKARLTDDPDMVQDLNSVQTELPGGLSRTQVVTWRSGIAPVL